MSARNRNKLLHDVFQENVEVPFELPEQSPLATLSVVDQNASQVPRPQSDGRSVLLSVCPVG